MEGIMYMRSSSSRSISASATERSLLLGALAMHMGVLDTRENDAQTVLRKSELWDEITRHFNANTTTPRSRQQIQTLYKNMKAKARRYEARLIEVASGIPPPDPDPISEMLLGLLHQQLRHQQRHLRNMVARETNNMQQMNSEHPNAVQQSGAAFINPEQMMQVSLSEGSADDIDIKSELDEDEAMTEEDLVSFGTSPQPFPEINESTSVTINPVKDYSAGNNSPGPEQHVSSPSTSVSDNSVSANKAGSAAATQTSVNKQKPPLSQPSMTQLPLLFPFGFTDYRPSTSGGNNMANPMKNLSNTLGNYKIPTHNEEMLSKEVPENARPILLNPPPKRQKSESFLRNCRSSLSKDCSCCPEIHTKLLVMAQEEHTIKMSLLKKDGELMTQEHTMRMKILALEEEEIRLRVQKIKMSMSSPPTYPAATASPDIKDESIYKNSQNGEN
ncbi:hypothetical protein SK128_003920 [Halocaridina rubra]|uniref:Regulatory protein zeste n=1 Tax=Halocaridina rubra TaxID=373956 RepID=A0AAN9A4Z6_HALRR